ncbi:ras-related protein Rab-8A-like [Aphidius gifuensis]|uniref:ras-related protein Rab-8A-like n=1 Tax=Aphidius gifuensis TaxID=684658 RepID=UPI001CDD410B|nr:ras-related protein Rab-8A-like [Aphidius gifuensis]
MFSFSEQQFTQPHTKCNYRSRIIELDGENIELQIWHAWMLSLVATGRQYTSIKKKYYNDTHGIMLVYDVTNEKSFENLEYWISQIKDNAPEDVVIILLGSKCDLKRNREVPTERAEQFADKYGIKFFEISSKLNINMEEVLYSFARDIYTKMKEQLEILKTLQNDSS